MVGERALAHALRTGTRQGRGQTKQAVSVHVPRAARQADDDPGGRQCTSATCTAGSGAPKLVERRTAGDVGPYLLIDAAAETTVPALKGGFHPATLTGPGLYEPILASSCSRSRMACQRCGLSQPYRISARSRSKRAISQEFARLMTPRLPFTATSARPGPPQICKQRSPRGRRRSPAIR
jgi:hypothetical protein